MLSKPCPDFIVISAHFFADVIFTPSSRSSRTADLGNVLTIFVVGSCLIDRFHCSGRPSSMKGILI